MIRGINHDNGVLESNALIRKVFEERFGSKMVISVQTVRRTNRIQQIFKKKKRYKELFEQYRMQNHY